MSVLIRSSRALLLAGSVAACGGSDSKSPTAPPPPTPQFGSVAGAVRDQSNAAVAGATVSLTAAGQTTQTQSSGADGSYLFASVPVGSWTATITPPAGFIASGSTARTVTVTANTRSTVDAFVLTRDNTPAPQSVNVTIQSNSFSPGNVTVARGGTVTWTNRDPVAHNAVGSGGAFDTGTLAANQSRTLTFNTAGTFPYVCTFHAGMSGSVTVR